jgi:hypothetical protein
MKNRIRRISKVKLLVHHVVKPTLDQVEWSVSRPAKAVFTFAKFAQKSPRKKPAKKPSKKGREKSPRKQH